MNYRSGEEARLGDEVLLGDTEFGVVVCSPDTDEFSADYPRKEWQGLGRGILVRFENLGLIHYIESEEALVLLRRTGKN